MKICLYTVKVDTGFAPNPFYGYCTLTACTPNHMNAKLDKGDYIAGFLTDRGEPLLDYEEGFPRSGWFTDDDLKKMRRQDYAAMRKIHKE